MDNNYNYVANSQEVLNLLL